MIKWLKCCFTWNYTFLQLHVYYDGNKLPFDYMEFHYFTTVPTNYYNSQPVNDCLCLCVLSIRRGDSISNCIVFVINMHKMNPSVFHTPSLQIAHLLHNKVKGVACHKMVTNLQHKLFQIWLVFFCLYTKFNGLWVWCFMTLSAIFHLYHGGHLNWWITRRKPPTCRKSLTNFT
jgi:hypothetical protein